MPAVIVYSEIYQVTPPIQRLVRWLAGYGYLAVAGDIYHEYEGAGVSLPYNDAGTERGNALKVVKPVNDFDADADATVAWIRTQPRFNGAIGAVGLCLGGHLAFRAAFNVNVTAVAAFFPTDIHSRSLGEGKQDNTLIRAQNGDISADTEILLVFGKQDPHIPVAGRTLIRNTLIEAKVDVDFIEVNANHAFLRDESSKGRYDPALADCLRQVMLEMFHRKLFSGDHQTPAPPSTSADTSVAVPAAT